MARAVKNLLDFDASLLAAQDAHFVRQEVTRSSYEMTETAIVEAPPVAAAATPQPEATSNA
jgi:hypothetical protein